MHDEEWKSGIVMIRRYHFYLDPGQEDFSMASLFESFVSLKISGDSLVPDEITRLLGNHPTTSGKKGEMRIGIKTGIETQWRTGIWILRANNSSPANVDRQVSEILEKLTSDIRIWRSLTANYEVDLGCGFMMKTSNEGLELSSDTLKALSSRGIKMSLMLYAP